MPSRNLTVCFPLAGQGARFGYTFKPFLRFGSELFIEAAVRSFRPFLSRIDRFVFIYLEEQERAHAVQTRLEQVLGGLPVSCVRLSARTEGPAETVWRGVDQIGARGEIMICDCDHWLDLAPVMSSLDADARPDCLFPGWPLEGEEISAWAVAAADDDGRVTAIAEKQVPAGARGALGVIGCYYFRDVLEACAVARRHDFLYMSDIIRHYLSEGRSVRAIRISNAQFFGDPARLRAELGRRTAASDVTG